MIQSVNFSMSQSLNLVFCGTPRFAVPTLEKLAASGFSIALVVTQPDRPKGRGLELAPSPVKQSALQLRLPFTQPDKIKTNDEFRAQLTALRPDAIVIVGYGRIIPQWMLDMPPLGNINLHASLLPKYRGAAPIQWAIATGETVTGVTTMRIDAGLDTGDILQQVEERIAPEDTAATLAPRLAPAGAGVVILTVAALKNGSVTPRPQDSTQATLAPILKREDGLIDFSHTATDAWNRLRGFQPWPGAFTRFRGKMLHLHAATPALGMPVVAPGHFGIDGDRLLLGFAHETALDIKELQVEGKKRMSTRDFINGYRPTNEEELGI